MTEEENITEADPVPNIELGKNVSEKVEAGKNTY